MVSLFSYGPSWGLPCISPFVTKVAYYMDLAGIPYRLVRTNPFTLIADTPHGKLPMIEDVDGAIVSDSTTIIHHLEATRGQPLDGGADDREQAQMVAFNRLLDEHFYWTAVIQPRWREQLDWETYVSVFQGNQTAGRELRQKLATFRRRILAEFEGQGAGRCSVEEVYARARRDVDALAGQLGARRYFMGDKLRSIDATVLAFLKHTLEVPFEYDTKRYIATKPELVDYVTRLSDQIGTTSNIGEICEMIS